MCPETSAQTPEEQAKQEEKPARQIEQTPVREVEHTSAGDRLKYTTGDKWVAAGLTTYLVLALIGDLWFILDTWVEKFSLLRLVGYGFSADGSTRFLKLVMYAMAGGWLGGVVAAARSLQSHYTATVEYVGDVDKQERTRFHAAWWSRWFWGPWKGLSLALIVQSLLRSGVLVFAGSPDAAAKGAATESFAALGLGALVGLGAKDVIEKLLLALKGWLRIEETPAPKLVIKPSDPRQATYGGSSISFKVEPEIAVKWSLEPSNGGIGSIVNGIFRPAESAPADAPQERTVIVTATSKKDPDRSASVALALKKT